MIKYENGKMYEGEWIIGQHTKHGRGCCIYTNGQFYEGWWSENKRNGFGRTILGDGEFEGDWYQGEYMDDMKHGYGIYFSQQN